jgi:hypothetical protein
MVCVNFKVAGECKCPIGAKTVASDLIDGFQEFNREMEIPDKASHEKITKITEILYQSSFWKADLAERYKVLRSVYIALQGKKYFNSISDQQYCSFIIDEAINYDNHPTMSKLFVEIFDIHSGIAQIILRRCRNVAGRLAYAETWIGKKVALRSGQPFKSGLKQNTVKDVVEVENKEKPKQCWAFVFEEDPSTINVNDCDWTL